jgi:hypothetical protein
MAAEIESRTIDGRLFLAAEDVVTALRLRASEYHEGATEADERDHALCYEACATELQLRADAIDLAAIEHVST